MLLTDEISSLMSSITNMKAPPIIMQKVGENAVRSMLNPHSSQVCFRASSIGKPWILQVLNRWYPSDTIFDVSTCMKMLDGIIAQAWAEEILNITGHNYEAELELRLKVGETEVVGHSDIIVTNHATRQKTVIECKSMAGHVLSKFYSSPHDDHGYISQLAFYTMMVQRNSPGYTVEPMFLLFDRSNGVFKSCNIRLSLLEEKFERVEKALSVVAAIPQFDLTTLLETVGIPPTTGGAIPGSMKWSRWAKAFYYEVGKEIRMHPAETSKRLILNMTQNSLGGL